MHRGKLKSGVRLLGKERLGWLFRIDLPFETVIGHAEFGQRLLEHFAIVHADPVFGDLTRTDVHDFQFIINALESYRAEPCVVNVIVEASFDNTENVGPDR